MLALIITTLANYHIEIGFGQRNGDTSCIARGLDWQVAVFNDVSL